MNQCTKCLGEQYVKYQGFTSVEYGCRVCEATFLWTNSDSTDPFAPITLENVLFTPENTIVKRKGVTGTVLTVDSIVAAQRELFEDHCVDAVQYILKDMNEAFNRSFAKQLELTFLYGSSAITCTWDDEEEE